MKKSFSLYLQKFPSGKWGWVGSVPIELCEIKKNHIGQKYYTSKVYNTKEEAEKDAIKYNFMYKE